MNKRNIFNLSIISIILLSLTILSGCTTTDTSNDTNNTNDQGHTFSFSLLDGTSKDLQDYRGKIVIIDLWATWCQPCAYQMLELKKTYENYSRQELEIISINTDHRESVNDIQDFKDEFASYGYDLDWVFAQETENLNEYNPEETIPRLIIFDQEGLIHWAHNGIAFYSTLPDGWTGEKTLLKEKIDELIK